MVSQFSCIMMRTTLFFRSVKDLARIGLNQPMYVSVHEKAQYSTPAALEQSYIVCELHNKLNTLWFFIRNHLKSKILVFVQTAKQVSWLSSFMHNCALYSRSTISIRLIPIIELSSRITLRSLYTAMPQSLIEFTWYSKSQVYSFICFLQRTVPLFIGYTFTLDELLSHLYGGKGKCHCAVVHKASSYNLITWIVWRYPP